MHAPNHAWLELKTTKYIDATRQRPDRSMIELAWIERVAAHPQLERLHGPERANLAVRLTRGRRHDPLPTANDNPGR